MTGWIQRLKESRVYHQWAPDRLWQAAQEERDLLFLHYKVDADEVRAVVPPALELQRFDGSVWVGVIALQVAHARLAHLRFPKSMRKFPEVDLITYVSYEGRRGIYFLSIESARRWLSPLVRWSTGLPYLYSGLKIAKEGNAVRVTSGPRDCEGAPPAVLDLTYRPLPHEKPVDPGSPIPMLLDQFSAFAIDWLGRVRELDEVHEPWCPMEAEAHVRVNTLGTAVGVELPELPTLVHYAEARHILTWKPELVRPGRPGLAPTRPRR